MKKILAVVFAVLLIAISSVAAMAAPSPTAPIIYKITVEAQKGGSASSSVDIVYQGEYVILTATEDDGYTFKGWVIDGDYEIVEGDLGSLHLVIRPKTDIHAEADFNAPVSPTTPTSPTAKPAPGPGNDSPISPQTGYDFIAFFGLAALLAAGGVLYTVKKRTSDAK